LSKYGYFYEQSPAKYSTWKVNSMNN